MYCRSARRNSSRSFSLFLILTLFAVNLLHSAEVGKYSLKMDKYSGGGLVSFEDRGDTAFFIVDMNVRFGVAKLYNEIAILKDGPEPLYIETRNRILASSYKGGTIFNDTISYYYKDNDTTVVKGSHPVNDWLALPFFFIYFDGDTVYDCTLLQGDARMHKSFRGDTVYWMSSDSIIVIKLLENIPVFIKSKSLQMTKVK